MSLERVGGVLSKVLHEISIGELARKLELSQETLVEASVLRSRPMRKGDPHSPYRRWPQLKSDGVSIRWITAPHGKLKAVQDAIYERLLLPHYQPSPTAHGFIRGRSIKTNAEAHIADGHRPQFALNADLKDAFPSVNAPSVIRIFEELTGAREMAMLLAFLTTWEDVLPQGAPTSPALLNLALQDFDSELVELAKRIHATATRYVDDITVSCAKRIPARTLGDLKALAKRHGFALNPKKTRWQEARGAAIEITGLKVVELPASGELVIRLPRETRLRFRGTLFRSANMPLYKTGEEEPADGPAMAKQFQNGGWYNARQAGICIGMVGLAWHIHGALPSELEVPYQTLREMGRLPPLHQLKNRKWRRIVEAFELAYADSFS